MKLKKLKNATDYIKWKLHCMTGSKSVTNELANNIDSIGKSYLTSFEILY